MRRFRRPDAHAAPALPPRSGFRSGTAQATTRGALSAHGTRAALLVVVLGSLASGCTRTPAADEATFRDQLADAFSLSADDVTIVGKEVAGRPPVAIIGFTVEELPRPLQARFVVGDGTWNLRDLRELEADGQPGRWVEPSMVIGRLRAEGADAALASMQTMESIATLVERYAVEHDGKYPAVDLAGFGQLAVSAEYVPGWTLGMDAWNREILLHAAADGQSYILLSRGSDGEWDQDVAEYFKATDEGLEIYDGETSDSERDLVYATGAFVQSFADGP